MIHKVPSLIPVRSVELVPNTFFHCALTTSIICARVHLIITGGIDEQYSLTGVLRAIIIYSVYITCYHGGAPLQ